MGIKRTFIKNTSLNIISYVYLAVAVVITIPILVKNLGIQTFGLYTIITSITPILSALDFGVTLAVIRYLALPDVSEEKKTKVWQTSFWFFAVVGTFLFFLVIAIFYLYVFRLNSFSSIIDSERYPLMFIVALTVLVNHVNSHLLTLPQAKQRFDIFSLNAFIAGTASTLITAVVSLFKPDLFLIFLTQFLGVFTTASILFLYANRQFPKFNFPRFSLDSFREVIGFGLKSFIGKVMSSVEANGLNLVIASYVSLQAVAYFSIPQSLILKAAGGISMLTLSLFPLSTSLLTKDGFPKLKKLLLYLQFAIVGLTFAGIGIILFFGKPLLLLWLQNPDLVVHVYPILLILCVQLFFTSLTPMPTAVLEGMNLPQIPSFFAFLTVAIEFGLIAFLLPQFGVNGVAQSISIASVITVPLFLFIFLRRFRKYERSLAV